MGLVRNLLALIGLVVVIGLGWAYTKVAPTLEGSKLDVDRIADLWATYQRLAPKFKEFDPEFPRIYTEFFENLAESGDPGVAMMWSVPVEG